MRPISCLTILISGIKQIFSRSIFSWTKFYVSTRCMQGSLAALVSKNSRFPGDEPWQSSTYTELDNALDTRVTTPTRMHSTRFETVGHKRHAKRYKRVSRNRFTPLRRGWLAERFEQVRSEKYVFGQTGTRALTELGWLGSSVLSGPTNLPIRRISLPSNNWILNYAKFVWE